MAIKKRKAKSDIGALRNKYPEGTLERVRAEADEYNRLDAIGKEHGNAASRQNTVLKNSYKALAKKEKLKPTDEVFIDGTAWRMGVTESERVDVEALFKLYQDEEISESQFLECISASKTDVKRSIGADYLITLTIEEKGDKVDVRKRKLTQDEIGQYDSVEIVRKAVTKKAKKKKPRSAAQSTPAAKAKRNGKSRRRLVKH